jgi:tetratricopeptide (TPR) repeat protein
MDDFFDSEEEEFEDIEVSELVHRYEQMLRNNGSIYLTLDDYEQLFAYYMMIENDAGMYSDHPADVNMKMAASILKYGMRQYPNSHVLQMFKIYYKYEKGDYSIFDVVKLLGQIEIPEYDRMNTGFCKGRIYKAIGANHAAVPVFEELLEFAHTKGDKIDIYSELISIITFVDEENIDRISYYLEKVTALDPLSELEYLTQIEYSYGKSETILAILERYVNRHLFSMNAWSVLGKKYCYHSRYEEAVDAYKKAIALSDKKNEGKLFISIGDAYKGWEKKEKALEYYLEAMPYWSLKNKDMLSLVSNIASLYFETGQSEQAGYYYNLSIEANPNDTNALYYLGVIYYEKNEYDLAIHYLERARRFNMKTVKETKVPCNTRVLFLLSKCMIRMDRSDEMEKIFEQMSKYFYYNIDFWLVYAEYYAMMNNYGTAMRILDKGIPVLVEAFREIEKEYEITISLTGDVKLLYRKANYCFIAGHTDCGMSCLKKALMIDVEDVQDFLEYDKQTAELPEVIEIIKEFTNKNR